jgi:hypothetical protein
MAMPPNMFENTGAFQDEVRVEMDEDEEREEHLHGPDCGHEAVEHDGHIDYIDGEHRHWWNKRSWDKH